MNDGKGQWPGRNRPIRKPRTEPAAQPALKRYAAVGIDARQYATVKAKELDALEAEVAALRVKAELAERAHWWMSLALQQCIDENLILHIPIARQWLADYDAAQKAEE